MSAVEELQAAIDKLTAIRDLAPVVATFRNVDDAAADWFARAEQKLAIFHATIDAQLAILSVVLKNAIIGLPVGQNHMALARAINGKEPK